MAEEVKQQLMRIDDAQDMILAGKSKAKVVKYLTQEYDISLRTAYSDFNTASLIIKQKSKERKSRDRAFSEAESRLNKVYDIAEKKEDTESMLKAIEDLRDLWGIKEATEIKVNHHHRDMTVVIGGMEIERDEREER